VTRRLPPPLLALTPGTSTGADGSRLLTYIARAMEGGLQGVLLREPDLDDAQFLVLAHQLRALLAGGWLGLHDRAHLVASAHADGVHLGFRSLCATDARLVVGDQVTIGVSDHAGDAATDLACADYRTYGPLHETPSKVGVLKPVGHSGVLAACAAQALPTWVLGGVNPQDVVHVQRAGAQGIAVLSGVLGSEDPEAAARAYSSALMSPS
jgi:thiamine-phosphate pyrophosphorylase